MYANSNYFRGKLPAVSSLVGWPLLGAAMLWLCFYPFFPLFRDQAIFAYLGMVIADGGVPYRDAWEVKGPLAHYLYALPVALGGSGTVFGIRLLDMLFVGGGVWSLRHILRNLCLGEWFPLTAGMAIFLWTGSFASSAQPDGWVGIILLAMLSALISEKGMARTRVALLCGTLAGLAFWIKPVHGVFLALPAVYALTYRLGTGMTIRFVAAACFAFAGIVALGLGWFAAHGALADLWDAMIVFNLKAHAAVASAPLVAAIGEPFLLLIAACSVPWFRRNNKQAGAMLLAAYGFALIVMLLQRKFFHYQGLPMYAVMLATVGPALAGLAQPEATSASRFGKQFLGLRKSAITVGLFFLSLFWVYSGYSAIQQIASGKPQFKLTDYRSEEIEQVAAFVRTNSGLHDTVLTIGLDTGINYLAGRHSPTRIWFYSLLVGKGEMLEQHRQEAEHAILTRPPKMIALNTKANNALFEGGGERFLNLYPKAVQELVETQYEEAFRTEHWAVYRASPPR